MIRIAVAQWWILRQLADTALLSRRLAMRPFFGALGCGKCFYGRLRAGRRRVALPRVHARGRVRATADHVQRAVGRGREAAEGVGQPVGGAVDLPGGSGGADGRGNGCVRSRLLTTVTLNQQQWSTVHMIAEMVPIIKSENENILYLLHHTSGTKHQRKFAPCYA